MAKPVERYGLDQPTSLFDGWENDVLETQRAQRVMQQIHVVQACAKRGEYSPDFSDLRHQNHHLVFFYDWELKKRGSKNILLQTEKTLFLGDAYSCTASYWMRRTADNMTFVAHATTEKTQPHNHLLGEVYAVPPEVILDLDVWYRNNFEFTRQYRNFFLMDQEPPQNTKLKNVHARCWTYLGEEGFWDKFEGMRMVPVIKNSFIQKMVYLA